MNILLQITMKWKEILRKFLKKISKGCNRPESKFTMDMIYEIAKSKDIFYQVLPIINYFFIIFAKKPKLKIYKYWH